jgi:hypothetical protein
MTFADWEKVKNRLMVFFIWGWLNYVLILVERISTFRVRSNHNLHRRAFGRPVRVRRDCIGTKTVI